MIFAGIGEPVLPAARALRFSKGDQHPQQKFTVDYPGQDNIG